MLAARLAPSEAEGGSAPGSLLGWHTAVFPLSPDMSPVHCAQSALGVGTQSHGSGTHRRDLARRGPLQRPMSKSGTSSGPGEDFKICRAHVRPTAGTEEADAVMPLTPSAGRRCERGQVAASCGPCAGHSQHRGQRQELVAAQGPLRLAALVLTALPPAPALGRAHGPAPPRLSISIPTSPSPAGETPTNQTIVPDRGNFLINVVQLI